MNLSNLSRNALDVRRNALTALLTALKGLQAIGDYSQTTAYYETLRDLDEVEHEIINRVRAKGEKQRATMRDIANELKGTAQHESLIDEWQTVKQDYDATMSELRFLIEKFTGA